ncbi:dihydropteroate synthase [Corynebacterium pseudodiphtheriticum]|uniref:dihydropteroate synthase n=1 Tax=Corynebacterium pseudodiphtheriticum TaxID=37637 RepID=UPI00254B14D0|nr:dihydropteroate synthase [Corynebacterium pseudodiphtheriticum]MDK8552195.1 dihydropteroate synthase [Corynebacterium pseudodiphtheriticum]
MGIVNVTDDSFSDGGQYNTVDRAVEHAHRLIHQGADIIDVGGESTRPGATRVDPEQERQRITPVIRELAAAGIVTSIDTMRAVTAEAAVEAGVSMINDVSGGMADPHMYRVMAESGLPVCLMHWQTLQFGDASGEHDGDVVADVHSSLDRLVDNALEAGIAERNIALDPGLGFAKSAEDNWALLHSLCSFTAGRFPILVGASRKRFLAAIRGARGLESGPQLADPATAAVTALSAQAGAWAVRVHEVAVSRDSVDVAYAWQTGGQQNTEK